MWFDLEFQETGNSLMCVGLRGPWRPPPTDLVWSKLLPPWRLTQNLLWMSHLVLDPFPWELVAASNLRQVNGAAGAPGSGGGALGGAGGVGGAVA